MTARDEYTDGIEGVAGDDARVTAYALGALDDADMAEIDALLADDPDLQDDVASIRSLAHELTAAFAAEGSAGLTEVQRTAVAAGPAARQGSEGGAVGRDEAPLVEVDRRGRAAGVAWRLRATMLGVTALAAAAMLAFTFVPSVFQPTNASWSTAQDEVFGKSALAPAGGPATRRLARGRDGIVGADGRAPRLESAPVVASPPPPPPPSPVGDVVGSAARESADTLDLSSLEVQLDALAHTALDSSGTPDNTKSVELADVAGRQSRYGVAASNGEMGLWIGDARDSEDSVGRVAALMDRTRELQIGEKYEEALQTVRDILVVDPDNEAASALEQSLGTAVAWQTYLDASYQHQRHELISQRSISRGLQAMAGRTAVETTGTTEVVVIPDDWEALSFHRWADGSADGHGAAGDAILLSLATRAPSDLPIYDNSFAVAATQLAAGRPIIGPDAGGFYFLQVGDDAVVPIARSGPSPWTRASAEPLSTFSIDVDATSYATARQSLMHGTRPNPATVRVDEIVNAFTYHDPRPTGEHPFAVSAEVGPSPWAPERKLVRIGLRGRDLPEQERPAANLVFLVDVSGSMKSENKLPLVQASLRLLSDVLQPEDRVAIVTYANDARVALQSTMIDDGGRAVIRAAVDRMSADGSTNGESGIQMAYDIARANRIEGGVNRVILCTDGDFNVGAAGPDSLQALIERERVDGITLSVLGFGTDNFQDAAMERLSNHGNGNAAFIDNYREAERVLVKGVTGTLVTIAKDVKLQVDFNPQRVAAYRLIGYETRQLAATDFANDAVDAGDMGAGHTVTALYEIIPVGVAVPEPPRPFVEPSKYVQVEAGQAPAADETDPADTVAAGAAGAVVQQRVVGVDGIALDVTIDGGFGDEIATVRARYKEPEGTESVRFDTPITSAAGEDAEATVAAMGDDFRVAAAAAGFGMLLKGTADIGTLDFDLVAALAESAAAERDPDGERSELLELIRAAKNAGP